MPSSLFNVKEQLTFYGAYHNNTVNVFIHELFVPLLLWTFQVYTAVIPLPSFVPSIHYQINEYLAFDLNVAAIHAALYIIYYFMLEPTAAAMYTPQMLVSLLSATAFSYRPQGVLIAVVTHIISWLFQFAGHGFAEGRSPALLDNLIGAVVLAPFFVHLEILFALGYRPKLHQEIQNSIGTEILRVQRAEKEKKAKAE